MLVYSFEILEGEKVFINNGVISYMFDSFKWLKTFNKLLEGSVRLWCEKMKLVLNPKSVSAFS